MTPSPLERLPTELARKILLCLDRPSLLSFSLVNRICHSSATASLFKTIYLHLWNPESLVEQVERWNTVLAKYYAHALVRELILVDGSQPVKGLRNPYMRAASSISHVNEVHLYRDACDLRSWSEESDSLPIQSGHRGIKNDHDWMPLSDFVSQLPSIGLLTCASSNQLSDSVIERLSMVRPKLRLQMFNTALVNDSYLPILKVGMAPFLKSALVKLSPGRSENRGIAQLDLIIHGAPHLRELNIWWAATDDYGTPMKAPAVSSYDMDDRTENGSDVDFHRGQLDKLQIRVENGRLKYCLDYWARRTDFTKLKVLKLEGRVRRDCTDWSKLEYTFPSLETFSLSTWGYYWYDDVISQENYHAGLAWFLRRLNPLTRLRIEGLISRHTLITILEQHGSSVRQLWLETKQWPNGQMLDPEMVQELHARCAQVEDLKMYIYRLAGNEEEINMYRALGSIPTLRRLHLFLDYFPYRGYDTTTSSHRTRTPSKDFVHHVGIDEGRYSYNDLCIMLINHATDEKLARSIFTIMDANRASTTLLESLIIQPVNSWHPDINTSFRDLFEEIGRTYMMTRDLRDTHRNEVKVKELNRSRRMRTDARLRKKLSHLENELFEELWPALQSGSEPKPWYEAWSSFPLAGAEVEEVGGSNDISRLKWISESPP